MGPAFEKVKMIKYVTYKILFSVLVITFSTNVGMVLGHILPNKLYYCDVIFYFLLCVINDWVIYKIR